MGPVSKLLIEAFHLLPYMDTFCEKKCAPFFHIYGEPLPTDHTLSPIFASMTDRETDRSKSTRCKIKLLFCKSFVMRHKEVSTL